MNEVILTETEEPVGGERLRTDIPLVVLTRDYVYFNATFCRMFGSDRVAISRSGPYIIFREATGTERSYTVSRGNYAGKVGSSRLAQTLNPDRKKRAYPVMPVKGGGWCIKVK